MGVTENPAYKIKSSFRDLALYSSVEQKLILANFDSISSIKVECTSTVPFYYSAKKQNLNN